MSQNEKNVNIEEKIKLCRNQGISEEAIQFAVNNFDLLANLSDDNFEENDD